MKTGLGPATAWTERYETLRRYIVGGGGVLESPPLGLALWLAKGMAGWMRQWSQLTEQAPGPARPNIPPQGRPPDSWQRPLTLLLAQMALEHLQPQSSV